MSASNPLAPEHDRDCTGQGSPSLANFTIIRLERALAEARAALIEMNERLQERTQGMLGTIVGLRNRVRELERRLREVSPAVPTEAMLEREASRARLAQVHPADRFRAMFGEQVTPTAEEEEACAGLCEDCGAGALDLLPRGGALLCDVCRVGRGWPA